MFMNVYSICYLDLMEISYSCPELYTRNYNDKLVNIPILVCLNSIHLSILSVKHYRPVDFWFYPRLVVTS